MRTTTDHQKLEQAKVLLKEAGVIYMYWTPEDIRAMIEDKLSDFGLSFPVDEVMLLVNLTHLSCDDDDTSIWLAIEDAIQTMALNKLGA